MKCEWKKELVDGRPEKYVKTGLRFHPCDDFDPILKETDNGLNHFLISYCDSCDTDIRKPEPEKSLIVKSGKTFVMEFKQNDYIAIKTQIGHNCKMCNLYQDKICIINSCPVKFVYWKNFLNIKLTDEIALYRPMVIVKDNPSEIEIHELIFVNNQGCITMPDISEFKVNWNFAVELATAKELLNEM